MLSPASCRVRPNCPRAHLLLLRSLEGILMHSLAPGLVQAAPWTEADWDWCSLGVLSINQFPQGSSKKELLWSLLPVEQHKIWGAAWALPHLISAPLKHGHSSPWRDSSTVRMLTGLVPLPTCWFPYVAEMVTAEVSRWGTTRLFISWHPFLESQASLQGDSFGIRQVDSAAAA